MEIPRESLYNNKDQWSVLSIILQLLKRKSDEIHVIRKILCGYILQSYR